MDEISVWFFWKYSWDVGTLATNDSEFNVCLLVCLFAYFLTKIIQRDISGSRWDIFLEFFGGIPGMFLHLNQITLKFLYVCQSVIWLTSLLKYINLDNSCSGWDFFLKFLGDILGTLIHNFQINLIFFYVCQSSSWHTSLLKSDKFRDNFSSGWYIFLNFYGHIPRMLIHLFQVILNC